jgi:hypothetical protein
MEHGDDTFIFQRLPPSADGNPLGQGKMPAYLLKALQGHLLKGPLFSKGSPRVNLGFEGAVGRYLDLKYPKFPAYSVNTPEQFSQHNQFIPASPYLH